MTKSDLKYYLKRVLIGVSIGLILMLIKSHMVSALTCSNNTSVVYKYLIHSGETWQNTSLNTGIAYAVNGLQFNITNNDMDTNQVALVGDIRYKIKNTNIPPITYPSGPYINFYTTSAVLLNQYCRYDSSRSLDELGFYTYNVHYECIFEGPTNNWGFIINLYTHAEGNGQTEITRFSHCEQISPSINDQIINNDNYNYSGIINNQNNNTDEINDNINRSTNSINSNIDDLNDDINDGFQDLSDTFDNAMNDLKDSQQVCNIIDKNSIKNTNVYININGLVLPTQGYGLTDYINIKYSNIRIINIFNTNDASSICYYNEDKNLISCEKLYNINNLTIPNNTVYIRSTIRIANNKPTFEICKNGNQAIYGIVDDFTSIFGRGSVPTNDISDMKDVWDQYTADGSGLSAMVSAPLTLFQSIVNSSSNTCETYTIGQLLGHTFTLPCLNIRSYIGDNLWYIMDVILTGMLAYHLCFKFLAIFHHFSTLKEGDLLS